MNENKPVTIAVEETKKQLSEVINNSHLPAFILSYIVKDIAEQLDFIQKQQYETDKREYEKSLSAQSVKKISDFPSVEVEAD